MRGDMEKVSQQLHLQAFSAPVGANIKLLDHCVSYL